ncbi:Hypothetical Protein FCC1311_048522 [Hondaea fermentalgiana]|uniref:Uncharacterized protein n=1 Tax=Hondaea fermentalgiana TaxID=2315210 RepID=A0A2R5GK26_9STRA|nr:Hypothetical Protein FCC1311_048522 [Hondaea fermentalgiana]|eukprot:GBG28631.1 Hypothetical Protein FCC1311_048522 [Hondaea fermentalgiana]
MINLTALLCLVLAGAAHAGKALDVPLNGTTVTHPKSKEWMGPVIAAACTLSVAMALFLTAWRCPRPVPPNEPEDLEVETDFEDPDETVYEEIQEMHQDAPDSPASACSLKLQ